jgi:hypothetical protein
MGFEFLSVAALKHTICWDVTADEEAVAAACWAYHFILKMGAVCYSKT